jgi:hypothetical protein
VNIQLTYPSELTVDSQTYYRDCRTPNYHYETFEINVVTAGAYTVWSESEIETFGYIYKHGFDPLQPFENLLLQHSGSCNGGQFKLITDLQIDTRYILVVTTYDSNVTGNYSVWISGPNNISFNHFSKCG